MQCSWYDEGLVRCINFKIIIAISRPLAAVSRSGLVGAFSRACVALSLTVILRDRTASSRLGLELAIGAALPINAAVAEAQPLGA